MSEVKLKIGQRIECPYCEAYAVKPPSRPVEDTPIWSLPNNSPLNKLEEKVAEQSQQRTQALGKLEDATKCDLCDDQAEYRQCQRCMNDKFVGSHTDEEYRKLEAEGKKYYELIYAVATIFSDETRHETALRYIQEQEEGGPTDGQQARADLENLTTPAK